LFVKAVVGVAVTEAVETSSGLLSNETVDVLVGVMVGVGSSALGLEGRLSGAERPGRDGGGGVELLYKSQPSSES
jgi:hypothetical protein